jgi:hypothetical protein
VADWDRFKFGGTQFPLATSPGTLLQRADPALYYALAFCRSVITTYVDDAFRQAATTAELGSDLTSAGAVVRTTVPYDFLPDLQQNQSLARLPLLAIYRTEGTFSERAMERKQLTDTWMLDYMLPALDPGQTEIVFPIISAVERVLIDRITLGFDPSYQSGAKVFQSNSGLAGVSSIRIVKRERPLLEVRGVGVDMLGTTLRMLTLTLEVVEAQMPDESSFEPFSGADVTVELDPDADVDDDEIELVEFVVGEQPDP